MSRGRKVTALTLGVAGLLATALGTAAAASWSPGLASGSSANAQGEGLTYVTDTSVGSPTTSSLQLSWSAPASGATAGLTYAVYRSATANGTYTKITSGGCAAPASSPCTDNAGLDSGMQYYYEVFDTIGTNWTTTAPSVSGTTTASGVTVSDFSTLDRDGKPEQGDELVITFSGAIDPNTVCAGWSGTGATYLGLHGNANVAVSLTKHATGDDTLAISDTADCPGGLNLFSNDSLDLGASGYVSGSAGSTAVFSVASSCNNASVHQCSNVSLDATDTVLTITLGQLNSGSVGPGIASSGVTYVPSSAIKSAGGSAILGTATDSAAKFF